jgi:hypothetical protein
MLATTIAATPNDATRFIETFQRTRGLSSRFRHGDPYLLCGDFQKPCALRSQRSPDRRYRLGETALPIVQTGVDIDAYDVASATIGWGQAFGKLEAHRTSEIALISS